MSAWAKLAQVRFREGCMSRLSLIATAGLVALSLAGCGKKPESAAAVATAPGAPAINYTVKGANGETAHFATGAAVNVNLPSYAPLYPGAVVDASMTGSGGSGAGGTVMFHTGAKPADIIAFYQAKATTAGLGKTFASQSGDAQTFTAGKEGGNEGLQIVASPSNGSTAVEIIWSTGKKG